MMYYEKPEMFMVEFEDEDVIRTSVTDPIPGLVPGEEEPGLDY